MNFRQSLFWDVNPKSIDKKKHASYVIERILDFGNDREIRWMNKTYSLNQIKKIVKTSRVLHKKSKALWNIVYR